VVLGISFILLTMVAPSDPVKVSVSVVLEISLIIYSILFRARYRDETFHFFCFQFLLALASQCDGYSVGDDGFDSWHVARLRQLGAWEGTIFWGEGPIATDKRA